MSRPFQTIYCPWDYLLICFCFPAKHVSIASDVWWLARARQWFKDVTGQRAENEKEGHGEFVLFISAHREQDEQCGVQKRSEDSDHTFHPINHVKSQSNLRWWYFFLPEQGWNEFLCFHYDGILLPRVSKSSSRAQTSPDLHLKRLCCCRLQTGYLYFYFF